MLKDEFMVHRWFNEFGGIHTSSAFNVNKIQTREEWIQDLTNKTGKGKKIHVANLSIQHTELARTFFWYLKQNVLNLHERTLQTIIVEMQIAMGNDIDQVPRLPYQMVCNLLVRHMANRKIEKEQHEKKKRSKEQQSEPSASSGLPPVLPKGRPRKRQKKNEEPIVIL